MKKRMRKKLRRTGFARRNSKEGAGSGGDLKLEGGGEEGGREGGGGKEGGKNKGELVEERSRKRRSRVISRKEKFMRRVLLHIQCMIRYEP